MPAMLNMKIANAPASIGSVRARPPRSEIFSIAMPRRFIAMTQAGETGGVLEDALMRVGNRLFAQDEGMGALPTLYAATADIPGDSFVGPDGFQEQRGHPTLVGRNGAAKDAATAKQLWTRSEELTGVTFPLTAGVA